MSFFSVFHCFLYQHVAFPMDFPSRLLYFLIFLIFITNFFLNHSSFVSLSVPESRSLQESVDQYTLIQLPYHRNTPLPGHIKEIDILKKRSQHHQWKVSLFQSTWVSYRRSVWTDKPEKKSFPFATKTNSSRERERKARTGERIVFCQELQNFRIEGRTGKRWPLHESSCFWLHGL